MPEGLATEDGAAIDLDRAEQEFARAMAAPEPGEPEAPAPPKRAPADEEAPFGRKLDGTPKKAPGGRPVKPRVTDTKPVTATKGGKGGGAAGDAPDYTQPLADLTSGLWMVLAAAPVPNDGMRIKLRAQAAILKENQPGIVQSVALMAAHNGTVRRGVEMLTTGGASWALPAIMGLAPFCVQTAQLWRTDPAELVSLAAKTEAEWDEQFKAMQQAMGLDKTGQLQDLAAERDEVMAA